MSRFRNTKRALPLLITAVAICNTGVSVWAESGIAYPPTPTSQATDTYFGIQVPDPYRWLEDGKSSTTIAWVNAEDRLAQDYLARLPRHQQLQNRFKELFYINQVFTPKQEGQRLFYERRKRDQEKPVF